LSFVYNRQESEIIDNDELVLPTFSNDPLDTSNHIIRPVSSPLSHNRDDLQNTSVSPSRANISYGSNYNIGDSEHSHDMDEAVEYVASFFGQPIPQQSTLVRTVNTSTPPIDSSNSRSPHQNTELTPKRISSFSQPSQPIAIGGGQINSFKNSQQSNIQYMKPNGNNTPLYMTNHTVQDQSSRLVSDQAPPDVIDSKDGHIWRAKYCILEGGVLFFYSNSQDGNSKEARQEREQMSLFYQNENRSKDQSSMQQIRDTNNELGKSPMPRNSFMMPTNSCSTASSNNSHGEDSKVSDTFSEPIVCEKYVALTKVGSVRSSNGEYGAKSFELISLNSDTVHGSNTSDDTADRLILRAESVDAMNNWIFEIHRSLKLFMKQFIKNLVHSQSRKNSPVNPSYRSGMNIPQNNLIAPRTPHVQNMSFSPNGGLALSHGHGRSGIFRKQIKRSHSPSSTPGDLSSSMAFGDEEGTADGMKYSHSSSYLSRQGDFFEHSKQSPPRPISSTSATIANLEAHLKVSSLSQLMSKNGGKDMSTNKTDKNVTAKYIPPALRGTVRSTKTDDSTDVNSKQPSLEDELSKQLEAEQMEFDDDTENIPILHHDSKYVTSTSLHSAVFDNESEDDELCDIMRLGGCADPEFATSSICDEVNIPLHASNVGKVSSKPYGYSGISKSNSDKISWDVGAISECGVRDSNEDAYLILNDFLHILPCDEHSEYFFKETGLFAIFDGHCKNHTARFAAEKLPTFLIEESTKVDTSPLQSSKEKIQRIFRQAIARLDREFCQLSTMDGRDWESGCTAIITLVMGDTLVVANIGDSNGVLCCKKSQDRDSRAKNWSVLQQLNEDILSKTFSNTQNEKDPKFDIIWKEVAVPHSPSLEDEKERIYAANGWISTDTEIPFAQLQRINFDDQDVVGILKRCFSGRFNQDHNNDGCKEGRADVSRVLNIYRVCGDLAVSRSLGDRLFKAAYNIDIEDSNSVDIDSIDASTIEWESPLIFSPDPNHSGKYRGDLVTAIPDISFFQVGQYGNDEFLLLACDGLWDVMDSDEAVRVTRSLLFEQELSTKDCAKRLAELAYFLGSSDNITVIVIRFQ